MKYKKTFSNDEIEEVSKALGITWDKFDSEQFKAGLVVELEHGSRCMLTNVTDDNPLITGKIALAHLNEFPDYYTRLKKMENEAEKFWHIKK